MAGQDVRQSSGAQPGLFYGYIVVAVAFIILVVVSGVHYAFGVFMKPMLTELGWSRAIISGAFSLSWIVQGFLSIVMGGLNDKFGPRIVLILSSFLRALGYILMSQVDTVWQLYLFYGIIIGIGMGGAVIPLMSTVARWFVERRGMMTGIVVAGLGIGVLIGSPVTNWLISTFDWRLSYIILGSIVLVVSVAAAQFLKRDPAQVGQKPYGEERRVEQAAETRSGEYSLIEVIYSRQFWLVYTMIFCFGLCLYAILVHIVPHATDLGISAATAASILAAIGGASVVGRVLFGNIADRIGNRKVYIICFILMSASMFWLMTAAAVWAFYIFAIAFGLAWSGLITSMSPMVAWLFGLRSHGLILGMVNTGFGFGCAAGPIIAGYIFDSTRSYQSAFLICAAVGIIGLILSALLTPIGGESSSNKTSSPV